MKNSIFKSLIYKVFPAIKKIAVATWLYNFYQLMTFTAKQIAMEVITVESKAYKELVAKINTIAQFVADYQSVNTINPEEEWIDSFEVCSFLNISQRTLQRLRSKGAITYSVIAGKTYYTIAEIKRMLNERRIRSSEEAMENLITNHQRYVEQRRVSKTNK